MTVSYLSNKRKDPKGTGMINYDDEGDIDVSVNKNLKSKFKEMPINSKSKIIDDDLDLNESVQNQPKELKNKEGGSNPLPFVINYHTIS